MNSIIKKSIESLPQAAHQEIQGQLEQFEKELHAQQLSLPEQAEVLSSIASVWYCSRFIAENCLRKPALLIELIESGGLLSDTRRQNYGDLLKDVSIEDEADLMRHLRQFRRQEMIRIAWRDLAGWAELDETLRDLSALADTCIQYALDYIYEQACARRGTPVLSNGRPQNIVVLGMGKLGAHELNYSSDIDLIFAYQEDGVLPDRKETSYGEFFTRICRSLVKVLDAITADGFVFRTDIRLRPFGDSGPVIMTFDGMENYYQTQAREWERYAMIKVRQVAGDFESGKELAAMLHPFVYRRYLDYGAFEELRSLKQKITQELQRKDRMENVKLGPGGIREIEFIGQAFQLIRGGKEKSLQIRGIMDVLKILGDMALLTSADAEQLQSSYCFLRRVENHIQQYQDKQAHDLPIGEKERFVLAFSMGYSNWQDFKIELDKVRRQVHDVFGQVFSLSEQEPASQSGVMVWTGAAEREELLTQLAESGFADTENVLKQIQNFKSSVAIRRLTSKGVQTINRLMPQVIDGMQQVENRDECLKRILDLFEAVAGRNVYLSLLSENPDALSQLIKLSAASSWISEYLSKFPVLFDELLDTRSLYEPLERDALDADLSRSLQRIEDQDPEQIMIALRQFKQLNVLRVAAADIMGAIPLMVVSDYLTYIAEVIVKHTINLAWDELALKHGVPPDATEKGDGFAVLGFGKLGGLELGYGSDLDMVFLSDVKDSNLMTNGNKSISCGHFYGRLGQKIMSILNTNLLSGIAYEVDMRLRPSGDSGLLVSPVNAYEDYLKNNAWTWEHQALVRGRFIAGDERLKEKFEAIRKRVLCLKRDSEQLKTEVREMREKMRDNLDTKESGKFDLKQSKGGIADIEFIVQFAVLNWAVENENLVTYTDNIRILDALVEDGLMSSEAAATLKQAYCTYRDYGHKQVLQGDKAVIDEQIFINSRAKVEKIWHEFMQ